MNIAINRSWHDTLPLALFCLITLSSIPRLAAAERPVEFNRDIRPILSNACFQCHGPDEKTREAGLRLDDEQSALSELESGEHAIVRGKPDESELWHRLNHEDADMRMPPADSGKPQLTPKQLALFKRWIQQGAKWQGHWSLITPRQPPLPEVKKKNWSRGAIDRFILAGLESRGLKPSPEADRETLIRRLALDLTGLPPTLKEIDDFLADQSAGAYETLVDRLLASPRYGEHMGRYWLDAARYGDTHGLHLDNYRSIWLYRDWVINAMNENMPFDQFAIEQLAGDLLPNRTLDQQIATGFVRAHVTTSEGGVIKEEVYVHNTIDRVETFGTVFLGLTAGCMVCHDHKFDPFTQKEFYQLFAFFNSSAESPLDGNKADYPPIVRYIDESGKKEIAQHQLRLATLKKQIQDRLAGIKYVEPSKQVAQQSIEPREHVWVEDALPAGAQPVAGGHPWKEITDPKLVYSGKRAWTRTAKGLDQHYFQNARPGLRIASGDKLFTYVYLDPKNPPRAIMLQFNDGSWDHRAVWGDATTISWGKLNTPSRHVMGPLPKTGEWVRLEVDAAAVNLKPDSVLNGWAYAQFGGTVHWDKSGVVTHSPENIRARESLAFWRELNHVTKENPKKPNSTIPGEVYQAIQVAPAKQTPARKKLIRDYYLEHVYAKTRTVFNPLHQQEAKITKEIAETRKRASTTTLVMQELPKPKPAYFLHRGEYDKRGEQVQRAVPAALPPLPKTDKPDRLTLARWLVDPNHPLTARVTVNRFWQQYFGHGIVKTSEDFGSQGEWPVHPELLDWLATEFIRSGWDMKALHKRIVTSATYRQASKMTPEAHERDPDNRLLARGPRFRMDAEMVRDHALFTGGLLVEKLGGPSVKPYQPDGIWFAVGYSDSNTVRFKRDRGDKLYRRSMYSFWKRTAPPPGMAILDAPSRETCSVRRARTNTPTGALLLMNDEQFVEAARHLAQRVMRAHRSPEERASMAFRLSNGRRPTAAELKILLNVYREQLAEFKKNPEAAKQLLSVGESKRDEALDAAEHAAWTMVANMILNSDLAVTKG